jgi:hypothetical protein
VKAARVSDIHLAHCDSLVAKRSKISTHIIRSTVSFSRCLVGGRNCSVAGSLSISYSASACDHNAFRDTHIHVVFLRAHDRRQNPREDVDASDGAGRVRGQADAIVYTRAQ